MLIDYPVVLVISFNEKSSLTLFQLEVNIGHQGFL